MIWTVNEKGVENEEDGQFTLAYVNRRYIKHMETQISTQVYKVPEQYQ